MDLLNTNQMLGPNKYNDKSMFNRSSESWFNDMKSVSFSRSKRFVNNNKLSPTLSISPKYESI